MQHHSKCIQLQDNKQTAAQTHYITHKDSSQLSDNACQAVTLSGDGIHSGDSGWTLFCMQDEKRYENQTEAKYALDGSGSATCTSLLLQSGLMP